MTNPTRLPSGCVSCSASTSRGAPVAAPHCIGRNFGLRSHRGPRPAFRPINATCLPGTLPKPRDSDDPECHSDRRNYEPLTPTAKILRAYREIRCPTATPSSPGSPNQRLRPRRGPHAQPLRHPWCVRLRVLTATGRLIQSPREHRPSPRDAPRLTSTASYRSSLRDDAIRRYSFVGMRTKRLGWARHDHQRNSARYSFELCAPCRRSRAAGRILVPAIPVSTTDNHDIRLSPAESRGESQVLPAAGPPRRAWVAAVLLFEELRYRPKERGFRWRCVDPKTNQSNSGPPARPPPYRRT